MGGKPPAVAADVPRCRSAYPPLGMSRIEAAHYVGVSPTMYDTLVRDGRMPQPKVVNSRVIWDRRKIEVFFSALPDRAANPAEQDGWGDWR